MPTRNSSAVWEGGLRGGKGSYNGESGIGGAYSFGSRFEEAGGSNPEELLAAAEAACFSMALALGLEKSGATPVRVETTAACTVEKAGEGFRITTMKLVTRAKATGIDNAAFQKIAAATKDGCPVSQIMKGNVDIQLDATLE